MNRTSLIAVLISLPGLTAAQVCTDIKDDAERLACYDARNNPPAKTSNASAPPAKAPATPPVTERPAPVPPEPANGPVASSSPGDFGRKESTEKPKQFIEARIVTVTTSGLIRYLRLDNGQVWREVENSNLRFKEGRTVTITDGILDSYDLQMEGYNKIIKVKRVK